MEGRIQHPAAITSFDTPMHISYSIDFAPVKIEYNINIVRPTVKVITKRQNPTSVFKIELLEQRK
jgi:hypothetical protein